MNNKLIWILPALTILFSCSNTREKEYIIGKEKGSFESNIDIANEINYLIREDGKGRVRYANSAHYYNEFKKVNTSNLRVKNENLNWVERGPANVAGRTRTIVVDASDSLNNTWLIGTAGGGIWKTINAGGEWKKVSPDLPNLSIVTISQSVTNPNVLYAGSGEGALGGNFINGYGIFKSIDKGESWSLLEETAPFNSLDFQNVNRIIVHPEDENTVLAATSNGVNGQEFRSAIMKSTDGGETWEKIYDPESRAQQILFDPRNPDTIYVSLILRGVARSLDGGDTWELTSLFNLAESFGIERTELAIAPTNPDILYASVSYINRSGSGLFMTNDMGENWIEVKDRNNNIPDFLLQGEYDNCIVVSPKDEYKVFWGRCFSLQSQH
jgi:photosystem II stability/assembly factor-like uncharacterized protein